MDDQHNVGNEKANDTLQSYVENAQQEDDGQPRSIDNGVNAGEPGEVTEGVDDAAAATGEHREDSADSSPPPTSAVHLSDHHSSDAESLSRSIDTQLHATDGGQ